MRNAQTVRLAMLALVCLLGGLSFLSYPRATRAGLSNERERELATKLWEEAIAAKGGRERLSAVNNLQISIREKVLYKSGRVPYIEEDLYVFPNKFWEWNDQRETIFGFSLRMYDQDRNIHLWYSDRGKGGSVGIPKDYVGGRSGLITLYDAQLRYLMETKWVKPQPIRVEEGSVDGRSVDIVQAIVKGYPTRDGTDQVKIGFALDRQTHLPL